MKILNLIQGSEAWLIWRREHVTATDASVILRKNPYKDPFDLWQEKLEMVPKGDVTAAMQRGTDLEPVARALAIKVTGIEFYPAVVECDDRPWQVASLDGLSPCLKYILEIKCPNEATHVFALQEGIHNYYMAQMQHQLAVTGAECCYYMSYRPENAKPYAIIIVEPDEEYIADLIEEEHKFFVENMCQMKQPEKLDYTTWKRQG